MQKQRLFYKFLFALVLAAMIAGGFTTQDAKAVPPDTPIETFASKNDAGKITVLGWGYMTGPLMTFEIYRATSEGGIKTLIETTTENLIEDTVAGPGNAIPGKLYYYSVRACNFYTGCSGFTAEELGFMQFPPPTDFYVSQGISTISVLLSWTGSDNATYYRVRRDTLDDGNFIFSGSWTALNPFDGDYTAVLGKEYRYKVSTCNELDQCSNQTAGPNTGFRDLTAPTGVSASTNSYPDKVLVSWNPAGGATFYEIYRQGSGGSNLKIGTSNTTTYNDSVGNSGVSYNYSVKNCASFTCTLVSAAAIGSRDSRIFSDGFENGSFSAWDKKVGTIFVDNSSAIAGSFGATIKIKDKKPKYLLDDTPTGETRYRARFYLDINNLKMKKKSNFKVMMGRVGKQVSFFLQVRKKGSGYQIRAVIRADNKKNHPTPWSTLPNRPTTVEIDWKAAENAAKGNGFIRLYINGSLKSSKIGVNNDKLTLEEIRLGVVSKIKELTESLELSKLIILGQIGLTRLDRNKITTIEWQITHFKEML